MNSKIEDLKEELIFNKFKKIFLLEFTRQLIKNSSHAEMIKLQTLVEKEKIQIPLTGKERIREIIRRKEESEQEKIDGTRSIMHPSIGMFESQNTPEINPFVNTFKKEKPLERKQPEFFKRQEIRSQVIIQRSPPQQDPFRKIELWVPEPKLPQHIQYLKPTPINKDIELGKLNVLVKDPMVKTIECYGPDQNIGVKGRMGEKKTGIVLNKEEIDQIIQKFSKETKIPVQEGIFRVVSGRLILMAVISSVAGVKFTINKIPPENSLPPNPQKV